MRTLLLALALLAATPVFAEDAVDPRHQNEAVMAQTPQAAGLFAVQDDGTVKHLLSGLVCPARFPNAVFYHLFVFAADSSDVGCDYRRADDKGGAWAKLTIFAVKAKPDATLDMAFAQYRGEVLQTYPDAKSQGVSLKLEDKRTKASSSIPDIRSEEFLITMNGQTYTTQLYVSEVNGWFVEVRTSFVGLPNAVDAGREGPHGAVDEVGDRVMGPFALMGALGTIKP
jgi:hypothetical protein